MNSPKNISSSEVTEYLQKSELGYHLKHQPKINDQINGNILKPVINDNAARILKMRQTPSTADTRGRDADNFSNTFD